MDTEYDRWIISSGSTRLDPIQFLDCWPACMGSYPVRDVGVHLAL